MQILVREAYWPTSSLMGRYSDDTFFPKEVVKSHDCLSDYLLANVSWRFRHLKAPLPL